MAWRYGVPSSCQRGFLSDPREHARQGASADNDRGLMIFFPFFFFSPLAPNPGDQGTTMKKEKRGVRVDDSPPFSLSLFLTLWFSSSLLLARVFRAVSSSLYSGCLHTSDDRRRASSMIARSCSLHSWPGEVT